MKGAELGLEDEQKKLNKPDHQSFLHLQNINKLQSFFPFSSYQDHLYHI